MAVTNVEGSTIYHMDGTLSSFSHELLPLLAASGLTFFLHLTWEWREEKGVNVVLVAVTYILLHPCHLHMAVVAVLCWCLLVVPDRGGGGAKGVRGRSGFWVRTFLHCEQPQRLQSLGISLFIVCICCVFGHSGIARLGL